MRMGRVETGNNIIIHLTPTSHCVTKAEPKNLVLSNRYHL